MYKVKVQYSFGQPELATEPLKFFRLQRKTDSDLAELVVKVFQTSGKRTLIWLNQWLKFFRLQWKTDSDLAKLVVSFLDQRKTDSDFSELVVKVFQTIAETDSDFAELVVKVFQTMYILSQLSLLCLQISMKKQGNCQTPFQNKSLLFAL